MVNTWPKNFYVIPFQKLVFSISAYPELFEKNQRNKKELIFGQLVVSVNSIADKDSEFFCCKDNKVM